MQNPIAVVVVSEPPTVAARGTGKLAMTDLVKYPDGLGVSKLETPFAGVGTGRNLNTVAKLAAMATKP